MSDLRAICINPAYFRNEETEAQEEYVWWSRIKNHNLLVYDLEYYFQSFFNKITMEPYSVVLSVFLEDVLWKDNKL